MKKLLILLFSLVLVGCIQKNDSTNKITPEFITDDVTPLKLATVSPKEEQFKVEWNLDTMDRGKYEYETSENSDLVIEPNYSSLQRGDVIYFNMPKSELTKNPQLPRSYLGRVVGLSGETIEIQNGQVCIDDKVLDTFYAKALIRGMDEKSYFKNVDTSNIENEQTTRDYFNLNMEPVVVEENTVYVLVDQWWRGIDSKDFGLLAQKEIQGKVIGYSK
ncbi:signal peptidase I [Viridibacillus arvi]|uniref:signal peptidase I n=1 Tax=Viridibacillus arvi TaxID=263475 RepID=UPI003CFC762B